MKINTIPEAQATDTTHGRLGDIESSSKSSREDFTSGSGNKY